MAAVVALEAVVALVVGERHVAAGAAGRPAAGAALDVGGESAAILEEHRLLAAGEYVGELVEQQAVEMGLALVALDGAQRVRNEHERRPSVAVALVERRQPVLAAQCVGVAFERGGGAAQHRAGLPQACHDDGHVAGVVARLRVGLLVACVVLLVDDDQLQVPQRQKERRAGADDQFPAVGARQAQVAFGAARERELRVVGRHAAAEDAFEPRDELRRDGDFGHEQQHVAAAGERLGDQVDVELGLARTGDAVQQHGAASGVEVAADRIEAALLGRCECRKLEPHAAAFDAPFAAGERDEALLLQCRQRRGVGLQEPSGHLAGRDAVAALGRSDGQERGVLARRPPREPLHEVVEPLLVVQRGVERRVELGAGAVFAVGELLFAVARRFDRLRQGEAHHLAQRAEVVVGHPLPQGALPCVEQRTVVEYPRDGLDAGEVGPPAVDAPDDARVDAPHPELHGHGLPLLHVETVGDGVGVGGLRQRQDDIGVTLHRAGQRSWVSLRNPSP